jgi:hypothetical protein
MGRRPARRQSFVGVAYLDRLVVERPWEAVGEGVVAFLHDGIVLPQLLLALLVQQPAEDRRDADVER